MQPFLLDPFFCFLENPGKRFLDLVKEMFRNHLTDSSFFPTAKCFISGNKSFWGSSEHPTKLILEPFTNHHKCKKGTGSGGLCQCFVIRAIQNPWHLAFLRCVFVVMNGLIWMAWILKMGYLRKSENQFLDSLTFVEPVRSSSSWAMNTAHWTSMAVMELWWWICRGDAAVVVFFVGFDARFFVQWKQR